MFNLLNLLFPPRSDELLVRSTPQRTLVSLMRPREVPDTRPPSVTLFSYGHPLVRACTHEAKYHGNPRAFEALGAALAAYLDADEEAYHSPRMSVVPIPLGKKRQKERGFNQVEEVVRYALRHSARRGGEITLTSHLLERTRDTTSQVSLPREKREQNMRGAFRARNPVSPEVTYLLIDDVLTTGATLQAGIDALRAAGATTIIPLALAH